MAYVTSHRFLGVTGPTVRFCGWYQLQFADGTPVGSPQNISEDSNGTYGAEQTTYSWRTARGLDASFNKMLSGKEMSILLRKGFDISVPNGSVGSYRDIVDRRRSDVDNGHDFSTEKIVFKCLGSNRNATKNFLEFVAWKPYNYPVARYYLHFYGPAVDWSPITISKSPSFSFPSDTQRVMDGTRAVASASPVNPVTETAQNAAELYREGIPVPGRAYATGGLNPKTTGKTYLEVQFGLNPFLQWAKSMGTSIRKYKKLTSTLERNSGKQVRRRRQLYSNTYSTVVYDEALGSAPVWRMNLGNYDISQYIDWSSARVIVTDTFHSTCNFSGAFTYYLAPQLGSFNKIENALQKFNLAFGTSADIDVMWEVTPYSWLVDYFANIGQILANVTDAAQYSQVMKYGYIMHDLRARRVIRITGAKAKGSNTPLDLVTSDVTRRKKTRMSANPYGFGVTMDQLSPQQLAILSALGFAKGGMTQ
jgi:hypothetical protein